VAERLGDSLAKVYRDKALALELGIDRNLTFRGSEGDLMELLGNLMDNAFKWARRQVHVYAEAAGERTRISVEDDGPGIPLEQGRLVLARGARADQTAPGHGIGLAIVQDICEAYGGDLEIARSTLGGTAVRVTLGA
jgi:two-component system sensor histidine kinase PhoQ